MPTKYY